MRSNILSSETPLLKDSFDNQTDSENFGQIESDLFISSRTSSLDHYRRVSWTFLDHPILAEMTPPSKSRTFPRLQFFDIPGTQESILNPILSIESDSECDDTTLRPFCRNCQRCSRLHKKCSGGPDPCNRCLKSGHHCVYNRKRRPGVKRGSSIQKRTESPETLFSLEQATKLSKYS